MAKLEFKYILAASKFMLFSLIQPEFFSPFVEKLNG